MRASVMKSRIEQRESFVELIRQQEKSLYRMAKAILKNDDDAADAMQEAVLTCWEKRSTLKKPEFFSTWLMRILINKAKEIARRRKTTLQITDSMDLSVEENGYFNVEWEQMLFKLSEKYRVVVVLYYGEQYRVREIASILGITESSVKARLRTAREIMRPYYEPSMDGERV